MIHPVFKHKPWILLDSSSSCPLCWFFSKSRSHPKPAQMHAPSSSPRTPTLSKPPSGFGANHSSFLNDLSISTLAIIHSSHTYRVIFLYVTSYRLSFLYLICPVASHCTLHKKTNSPFGPPWALCHLVPPIWFYSNLLLPLHTAATGVFSGPQRSSFLPQDLGPCHSIWLECSLRISHD